MVVADDKVDALAQGVVHLLHGFDAAVQHDDKFDTSGRGKVNTFLGDAIALLVAVGDVVVNVGIILREELIDQGHSRTSVHIIVAIDEDALLGSEGSIESRHGHLHIVHEEGVVEVCQLRSEEVSHF